MMAPPMTPAVQTEALWQGRRETTGGITLGATLEDRHGGTYRVRAIEPDGTCVLAGLRRVYRVPADTVRTRCRRVG